MPEDKAIEGETVSKADLDAAQAAAANAMTEASKVRAERDSLLNQIATANREREEAAAAHARELAQAEEERQRALALAEEEQVSRSDAEKQRQALDLLLILNDIDQEAKRQGHSLPLLIDQLAKSQYGITLSPTKATTVDDLRK